MAKITSGQSDVINSFNLNGLDYPKNRYEFYYTNVLRAADGSIDTTELEVGVRSIDDKSEKIQTAVQFSRWKKSDDSPYTSLNELLGDLIVFLGFNSGGGSGEGLTTQDVQTIINNTLDNTLTNKGLWNPNTNTPNLQSGIGTEGDLYTVSEDSETVNLDGITSVNAGDKIVFLNGKWDFLSNTDFTGFTDVRNGEQWYVANNGDDTNGTGSINKPYLTVNNAIAQSSSADLITMVGGTYTQNIAFADGQSRCLQGSGTDNATLLNGDISFGAGSSIFTPISNIDIRGKFSTAGLGGIRLKDCKINPTSGNAVEINGVLSSNIVFNGTQIENGNIVITSLSANDIQIKNAWCPTELIVNSGVVLLDDLAAIGKITLNAGLIVINDVNLLKDGSDISIQINDTATAASGSGIYLLGDTNFQQADLSFGKVVRQSATANCPVIVASTVFDNSSLHDLQGVPFILRNNLDYNLVTYIATNYTHPLNTLNAHLAAIDTFIGTKAQANGLASLDANTKVPDAQLPINILKFTNLAGFPATGADRTIYIAEDSNFTYRWNGVGYVRLDEDTTGESIYLDSGAVTFNPDFTQATVGATNYLASANTDELIFDTTNIIVYKSDGTNWLHATPVIDTTPVGIISIWSKEDTLTIPNGYLLLDGSTVPTVDYPDLETARPEWVNGSNIELPDLRGYFLRGYDGGILTGNFLEAQGYATAAPVDTSPTRLGNSPNLSNATNPSTLGFVRVSKTGENVTSDATDTGDSGVELDIINVMDGDSETRPMGKAIHFIVKAKLVAVSNVTVQVNQLQTLNYNLNTSDYQNGDTITDFANKTKFKIEDFRAALLEPLFGENPIIYDNIFDAVTAGAAAKLGNPSFDDTTHTISNLFNGRPIIKYGSSNETDGNGLQVNVPSGYNTLWICLINADRWNVYKTYLLDNDNRQLGYFGGGFKEVGALHPNSGKYHTKFNYHKWYPINIGIDSGAQVAVISKPNSSSDFWVSGLAFSKNPTNVCDSEGIIQYWNENAYPTFTQYSAGSTNFVFDPANVNNKWNGAPLIKISNNTIGFGYIPVIPNNKDKVIYFLTHDYESQEELAPIKIVVNGNTIDKPSFRKQINPLNTFYWDIKHFNLYVSEPLPSGWFNSTDFLAQVEFHHNGSGANRDIFFRTLGTMDSLY